MFEVLNRKPDEEKLAEKFSYLKIKEYTEQKFKELNTQNTDAIDISEFKRAEMIRKNLLKVAKNCGKGDLTAKEFMKNYLADMITTGYGVTSDNIDYAFNFRKPETGQDKFEIMLYTYKIKKRYKYKALGKLLKEYELDKFREINGELMCLVSAEDIEKIYSNERPILTFEDKIQILVQRIYQETRGLSVIDEIRDMFIDGLSLGVSGVPADFIGKLSDMEIRENIDVFKRYNKSFDSIWLYYEGKEIPFTFLSFGSDHELERVCRSIYQYHDAPNLTRADGYGFNYMADLSRVAVFRPDFSECWCGFIRKFDVDPNIDTLYAGENYYIVNQLMHYLGRSLEKIAITGDQGTGKTTLLVAIVRRMYSNITLRVWEDYFEAFLRLKMPGAKNIMTIRRTDRINGEEAIDAAKKSNGDVMLITEVAQDEHIKFIVKVALAAFKTVLYTHHAVDADSLVSALRNGAINTGAFTNEDTAEEEVLKTLDFNIHIKKTPEGKRYISRITEFITGNSINENIYQKIDEAQKTQDVQQQNYMMIEIIKSMIGTNVKTKKYITRDIIRYDLENERYVVNAKISDKRKQTILENLYLQDREKFKEFIRDMEKQIETENILQ